MSQTVWPLNENGEIVFTAGTGSGNVTGYLNQDVLPSADGGIPVRFSNLGDVTLSGGSWVKFQGMVRLQITGIGTITIDARNYNGDVTPAVYTLTKSSDGLQIEYPFFGDSAVEVRAAVTGSLVVRII